MSCFDKVVGSLTEKGMTPDLAMRVLIKQLCKSGNVDPTAIFKLVFRCILIKEMVHQLEQHNNPLTTAQEEAIENAALQGRELTKAEIDTLLGETLPVPGGGLLNGLF